MIDAVYINNNNTDGISERISNAVYTEQSVLIARSAVLLPKGIVTVHVYSCVPIQTDAVRSKLASAITRLTALGPCD